MPSLLEKVHLSDNDPWVPVFKRKKKDGVNESRGTCASDLFFFFLSTVKRQLALLRETALFISKQKNQIAFPYKA